jgi:hypothetical protein
MGTALPVRHSEFLKEVEVQDIEGIKSGLIGFGTCDARGQVLRIKLKYADPSKKFYEELLDRCKQRYGEPDEWRGDPFHIFLAWKWSFRDKGGNRVSLTIQHNSRDAEEKMGNAVKLTLTSQMQKEEACFERKFPGFRDKGENRDLKKKLNQKDWDRFVPK